jgi:hypothetical protein
VVEVWILKRFFFVTGDLFSFLAVFRPQAGASN